MRALDNSADPGPQNPFHEALAEFFGDRVPYFSTELLATLREFYDHARRNSSDQKGVDRLCTALRDARLYLSGGDAMGRQCAIETIDAALTEANDDSTFADPVAAEMAQRQKYEALLFSIRDELMLVVHGADQDPTSTCIRILNRLTDKMRPL